MSARTEQRDTAQPKSIIEWAANDNLWSTEETVRQSLDQFAEYYREHIRDLNDAATRFEDRAKRAEGHAERLAEALARILENIRENQDSLHPIPAVCELWAQGSEAIAAWEGVQK